MKRVRLALIRGSELETEEGIERFLDALGIPPDEPRPGESFDPKRHPRDQRGRFTRSHTEREDAHGLRTDRRP